MHDVRDSIEKGLGLYQALVQENETLTGEFEGSLPMFFASGLAQRSDRAMATRRHLEWFLLERPSDQLGGVPAEALQKEWLLRAEPAEADLGCEPYMRSLAGAFEITSTEPENGLWLRDLFGHGEYPVDERDIRDSLKVGDLLVGRLFPVGGEVFTLSPAMSCFRNGSLVSAVRADLDRMRGARRGVLRIEQSELERLFFAPGSLDDQEEDIPTIDLDAERKSARSSLLQAGLDTTTAEDAIDLVVAGARDGRNVVTDVLEELAFQTDVDIEGARRTLVELWSLECQGEQAEPAAIADDGAGDTGDPGDQPVEPDDVRAAIEAFRAGRTGGGSIDGRFDQLADDLGIELPPEESFDLASNDAGILNDDVMGETSAASFPGVVGAIVEEFLWDVHREQGGTTADSMSGLRRLANYAERIGEFEALGRRELLDFAGRWLLDNGSLRGPEEARAVIAALSSFCRWSEDNHGHPLATDCDELLTQLAKSVPRLVVARQHSAAPNNADQPWDVLSVDADAVVLQNASGDERRVRIPPQLGQLLRPGDLVHARIESADAPVCGATDGKLCISISYPEQLRELLVHPE